MEDKVMNNDNIKIVRSEYYNYNFNYDTGFFARWGKTVEDDPQIAPFPEILDIEVTTKCKGPGGKLCNFCYKANTPNGKNMSFNTFKTIIDKMKLTDGRIGITQLAIGADAQCEANPDIWKMMEYSRECKIIPNITVADITDETADKLSKLCGAVAVSRYDEKDLCYNSIKKLADKGMKQVNIHQMISKESFSQAKETILDYNTDERLKDMNAIVFLSLKQKGRGTGHTPLTTDEFKELVELAFDNNVPCGFDSCGANKFLTSVKDHPNYGILEQQAEPCESTLFSSYINTDGRFFPCSFIEGVPGWEDGIDVTGDKSFEDIWADQKVQDFRNELMSCGRSCPKFNV
jgi:hypothetical protein